MCCHFYEVPIFLKNVSLVKIFECCAPTLFPPHVLWCLLRNFAQYGAFWECMVLVIARLIVLGIHL